jgi:hypothetical protein
MGQPVAGCSRFLIVPDIRSLHRAGMSNLPFIIANALIAALLIAGFIGGLRIWRTVVGKVVVIIVGVLLLMHLAFLALVGIIIASGRAGHPF